MRNPVIGMLLAILLALLAWMFVPGLLWSDLEDDARTVFCLQDSEREALADAAVALGLTPAGSAAGVTVGSNTITLQQWSIDRPDDFARACAALHLSRTANGVKASSVQPGLQAVLLALVAAALTFVTGAWRDRTARSHTESDTFRAIGNKYVDTTRNFLSAATKSVPDASPMNAARDELVSRLTEVRHAQPSWAAVTDVHLLLTYGPLDATMPDKLRRCATPNDRQSEIATQRTKLDIVSGILDLLAAGLANPSGADPTLRHHHPTLARTP